jgi:SAM-dependent methyltransferase
MITNSNYVDRCSLCNSVLELVLKLTPTPPANELLSVSDNNRECYPLNLMQCISCEHLQLDTEISKFRLFKNDYVYTSNASAGNYAYLHSYADQMTERFQPKFVVDVGSNDGTFLHFFKCPVLGVDPSDNIAQIARENGVPTKSVFFNEIEAIKIKRERGVSDLITCNNTFAHNRNLDDILLGVKVLLAPQGTFVFEISYALRMLEKNLFDLIYHEHFHHHHLRPLMAYLAKFNLQAYDAEVIEQTHGGSLRVYVQHDTNTQNKSRRLLDLQVEENSRFNQLLLGFKKQVPQVKQQLLEILDKLKDKQISVYGYPAKACTLFYYFELDRRVLKVYDDNVLKIGKYTHGGKLIEPATFIYRDKPDYLIIGAWNYASELTERHKLFTKNGGKFITYLPEVKIL